MSVFDEKAAEWDTPEHRERARRLADTIREHIPLMPQMRAIDIGAGNVKKKIFTMTPEADADTVDLSAYFGTIYGVQAVISAGADAALSFVIPTFSGTDVTLAEKEADFTAATDWTGAEVTLQVIGTDEGL